MSDSESPCLPVKPTHKLSELMDVMGFADRRTMLRWCSENGVPTHRNGPRAPHWVWLSDLSAAIPELERSLSLAKARKNVA